MDTPTVEEVLEAEYPRGIAPSNRSARSRVAAWLAIKALEPNITTADAAERMGIHKSSLNKHIQRAVHEGWLKFSDPFDRIDHELIPKTVRNLNEFLDQRDKLVTVEMAKGTIFKTYQESKTSTNQPQVVLALRIEPAVGDSINIVAGHIVGKAKEIPDESDEA